MKYAIAILLAATPSFGGGYVAPITDHPPVKPGVIKSQFNWSGAYVGLSAGRARQKNTTQTEVTEHHRETRPFTKRDLHTLLTAEGCEPGEVYELFNPNGLSGTTTCEGVLNNAPHESWDALQVRGYDPVITREWDEVIGTEVVTSRETGNSYGAFAGYRRHLQGGAVTGLEVSYGRSLDSDSIRASAHIGYALGRALPYVTTGYDFSAKEGFYGVGADFAVTDRVFSGLLYTKAGDEERIEARLGWRF